MLGNWAVLRDLAPLWRASRRCFAAFFCLCGFVAGAQASSLDREAMKALFPKPYSVGERDASLPVWPIFTQSYNGDVLVAYAFESIDFEPIPGFSGTPVNCWSRSSRRASCSTFACSASTSRFSSTVSAPSH